MIKWKLTDSFGLFDGKGDAEVSLDVADGNQAAVLKFSGDPTLVKAARSSFNYASGAFGHSIANADQPISAIDADYVLREEGALEVEVIEGAEIFADGYDSGIPEDALS